MRWVRGVPRRERRRVTCRASSVGARDVFGRVTFPARCSRVGVGRFPRRFPRATSPTRRFPHAVFPHATFPAGRSPHAARRAGRFPRPVSRARRSPRAASRARCFPRAPFRARQARACGAARRAGRSPRAVSRARCSARRFALDKPALVGVVVCAAVSVTTRAPSTASELRGCRQKGMGRRQKGAGCSSGSGGGESSGRKRTAGE